GRPRRGRGRREHRRGSLRELCPAYVPTIAAPASPAAARPPHMPQAPNSRCRVPPDEVFEGSRTPLRDPLDDVGETPVIALAAGEADATAGRADRDRSAGGCVTPEGACRDRIDSMLDE